MTRESYLVTGATGFIGSHLVRALVADGAEVHAFVRPDNKLERLESVKDNIIIWRGDITDSRSLQRCVKAALPQVVFHLAGDTQVRFPGGGFSQWKRSIDANLTGTLRLIAGLHRAGSSMRSFVRAGGLEEYGHGPHPYSEEQREAPVSAYSASQVAATHFCQMIQKQVAFPVVTVRPALVYGPSQSPGFFIPSLIKHVLNGQDFSMTSGEQARDLIYVKDVVDAFRRAADVPGLRGQVINVGSGHEYKMRTVAETIVTLIGGHSRLQVGAAAERATEIAHLVCSNRKAQELLSWKPATHLTTGLAETIEWYRNESHLHCDSTCPPARFKI